MNLWGFTPGHAGEYSPAAMADGRGARPRKPRSSCPRWWAPAGRPTPAAARAVPGAAGRRPVHRRHPSRRPGAGPGRPGRARSAGASDRPGSGQRSGERGRRARPMTRSAPADRRAWPSTWRWWSPGGRGPRRPLDRAAGRRRAQPDRRGRRRSSRCSRSGGRCGPAARPVRSATTGAPSWPPCSMPARWPWSPWPSWPWRSCACVHPETVDGADVVVVAAVAIVANVVAALVLPRRQPRPQHAGGRCVHMASDVLASFCVLVAGVVIVVTGGGLGPHRPGGLARGGRS